MSMLPELQSATEKLARLEAEQKQAEIAEQKRLEAERQHLQKIADTENEIKRLRIESGQEKLQSVLSVLNESVAKNRDVALKSMAVLDPIARDLLSDLQGLLAPLDNSSISHWNSIYQAGDAMSDIFNSMAYQDDTDSMPDLAPAMFALNENEKRIPGVLDRNLALSVWIASAPDNVNRQIRQGIGYCLIGAVLNPGSDFTLDTAYEHATEHTRNLLHQSNRPGGNSVKMGTPANIAGPGKDGL